MVNREIWHGEPRRTKSYKNYRTLLHTPHKSIIGRTNRHKIVYIPRRVIKYPELVDKLVKRDIPYYTERINHTGSMETNARYYNLIVEPDTYRINGETLYNAYVVYLIKKPKNPRYIGYDKDDKVVAFYINSKSSKNSNIRQVTHYKLKGKDYIKLD